MIEVCEAVKCTFSLELSVERVDHATNLQQKVTLLPWCNREGAPLAPRSPVLTP